MNRKFLALLVLAAFAMAVGGMACSDTQTAIDNADEGVGAT
jgi:hypothetical protein